MPYLYERLHKNVHWTIEDGLITASCDTVEHAKIVCEMVQSLNGSKMERDEDFVYCKFGPSEEDLHVAVNEHMIEVADLHVGFTQDQLAEAREKVLDSYISQSQNVELEVRRELLAAGWQHVCFA